MTHLQNANDNAYLPGAGSLRDYKTYQHMAQERMQPQFAPLSTEAGVSYTLFIYFFLFQKDPGGITKNAIN